MSSDKTPFLEKIAKLLSLANNKGATKAESEAAFAKASALMTQHGIEMHEITSRSGAKDQPAFATQGSSKFRRQEPIGAIYIRRLIRECFCVEVLKCNQWTREKGWGVIYQFLGTKDDCEMAQLYFEFLLTTFWRLYGDWCKEQGYPGAVSQSRLYNSFYYGCQCGFQHAWEEAKKEELAKNAAPVAQSYALVLVDKDKALTTYVDNLENVTRKTNKNREGSNEATVAGFHAGQTVKLHHHLKG